MFSEALKNKIITYFSKKLKSEHKSKVFYLWKASDTQSALSNYIAHLIYNSIENINGNLLRIMFITKSGSEGISFKTIRQIHIIEPFWQLTRETQVIGRGVRRGSHDELVEGKRNVFVYKYLSKSRDNEIFRYDSTMSGENKLTTDQYITQVAHKKQTIINTFYDIIKSVSLDCPYNNENLSCFSYNNLDYYEDKNTKPVFFNDGISSYNIDIVSKEAHLVVINNQKFIVYNNNLYDYEKYTLHNVLIKIGVVNNTNENISFNITRDYSANKTCFIKTNITTSIKDEEFNNIEIQHNNIEDIPNSHSIVKFNKFYGGAIDDEFSDYSSDEETEDDFNYDSDSINSDSEELIDEEDNIEEILNTIIINVNMEDQEYKINDYICLEDNITKDKILIGIIKKITTKYILVNDIKIPIINYQGNNVILYNVKDRKTFINELGIKLLNLYARK